MVCNMKIIHPHTRIAVLILFTGWILLWAPLRVQAQNTPDTGALLFLSPKIGTFLTGSTFDVSIFVDTAISEINSVEVNLKFPPDKLQIVKPSAGGSFISIWASPPGYSNKKGTLSFVGGLPNPGIKTSSGLIARVTFRAKNSGTAKIEILPSEERSSFLK